VRVALLPAVGNVAAGIAATQLLRVWHPAFVLLVGIAAGVPGVVSLGDVAVGENSYYYELAKITDEGDEVRPSQWPSDELLFNRARARARNWAPKLGGRTPDARTPSVAFGPIASGEKVVADSTSLAQLQKQCPKLIALAMEGAGVARAVFSDPLRPRFLEIRGVSDFANASKNDFWHEPAAAAAARFAVDLLRSRPIAPTLNKDLGFADPAAANPELAGADIAAALAPSSGLVILRTKSALKDVVWGDSSDTPTIFVSIRTAARPGVDPAQFVIQVPEAAGLCKKIDQVLARGESAKVVIAAPPMAGKSFFAFGLAELWLDMGGEVAVLGANTLSDSDRSWLANPKNLLLVDVGDVEPPTRIAHELQACACNVVVTRRSRSSIWGFRPPC